MWHLFVTSQVSVSNFVVVSAVEVFVDYGVVYVTATACLCLFLVGGTNKDSVCRFLVRCVCFICRGGRSTLVMLKQTILSGDLWKEPVRWRSLL